MLSYETAEKLYTEMKQRAAEKTQGPFGEFYKMFLKSAVEYANTRAAWGCMTQEERNGDDKARRIKHDALISMLTAVCRNLGMEDLEEILPDRKTKGDFACYIALFLGLEQR